MSSKWPREAGDPITQLMVPRLYGSVATIFGAPRAKTLGDLKGAQLAFLGIPWSAPVPDSRVGSAAVNYAGTQLTPHAFRVSSLKYGGYLPELDIDVFAHYRLVDYGDADVVRDLRATFAGVEQAVGEIIDAGAVPLTMGGNSGPSSYAVLQAIARRAGGPVAVVNFDAHSDNQAGDWEDDTEEQPRWGGTWARRILDLPGVDPAQYRLIGLRGPRNDRAAFERSIEKGVKREHIYTFRDIVRARRSGFEEWAEALAHEIAVGPEHSGGPAKVWIGVDPDVFDMSASPDFGDEPLGPRVDEVCWLAYEIGRAVGRERLGGVSFMAVPNSAMSLHFICVYVLLYLLAGTVAHGTDRSRT